MISQNLQHLYIFIGLVILTLIVFLWKYLRADKILIQLANKVEEAEKEAFSPWPKPVISKKSIDSDDGNLLLSQSYGSQVPMDKKTSQVVNQLFKLYNSQIQKYQEQTQLRAMSSFIFAIIAMFAGIIFVFWGGFHILSSGSSDATVAGSAIATIGGGVSAYITKTFLSVYKLSIQQLNHYFRQPVINDHIVMAQRLADQLDDQATRQSAYESIIQSVVTLIKNETVDESKTS